MTDSLLQRRHTMYYVSIAGCLGARATCHARSSWLTWCILGCVAEPGFAGLLTGDHEASIRTPAACRAHVVAGAFLPHGIQLWFADRSPQYAAGAVEPRSAAVRASMLDVVM